LATATRAEREFRSGVSPRGTLSLKVAAQARALAQGRAFVLPEDVQTMVHPVFGHRLALRKPMSDPLEERRSVEGLLQKIIEAIPEPV
jgi:MoxR-like ATPase